MSVSQSFMQGQQSFLKPKQFNQGLARQRQTRKLQIFAQDQQKFLSKQQSRLKKGRSGQEWLQSFISLFGPVKQQSQNLLTLEFEKPLLQLDRKIKEVLQLAEQSGVDVSDQVQQLRERAVQLRRDTYSKLNPFQRLQVARHPNRPTFLDVVLNITDKFVELHGDRGGFDDPSIVCGLGSVEGETYMFIGHQKGRNTKENIYRNFGMPHPNGYKKAIRFMKHANKYGFPIVTFIDTPGAFAGKEAEERGQGEAIAYNLREMFGLTVPMISIVLGEGGSGGALAIGCPNRMLIMEHGVYYVASPEACAAILWKSKEKSEAATIALRITSKDMTKLGIADEVILEPAGAAHSDPMATFPAIKNAIQRHFHDFADYTADQIQEDRYAKFRQIGMYEKFHVPAGQWQEYRDKRAEAAPIYTASGSVAFSEEEKEEVEREEQGRRDFEELLQDPKRSAYIRKPQDLSKAVLQNLNDKSAWFLLKSQEEKIQKQKEIKESNGAYNGSSENGASENGSPVDPQEQLNGALSKAFEQAQNSAS